MCEWLPDTVCVNPWTTDTYEILYQIFCDTIRDRELFYARYRVWTFPDIEDGKEEVFWHLTSREQKTKFIPRRKRKFYKNGEDEEKERLPDLPRCERLLWVHAFIENSHEPELLAWDFEEGDGKIKTYIWFRDEDFVVIMKRYTDYSRRLITSFYVYNDYTRSDFERKYANRI